MTTQAQQTEQATTRRWLLQPEGNLSIEKLISAMFDPDGRSSFVDFSHFYLAARELCGYAGTLLIKNDSYAMLYAPLEASTWTHSLPDWALQVINDEIPGSVRISTQHPKSHCVALYALVIDSEGTIPHEPLVIPLPSEVYKIFSELSMQGMGTIGRQHSHTFSLDSMDPKLFGLTFKLSVFDGFLQGLAILDINFETAEQADALQLPNSVQAYEPVPITDDPRYSMHQLAVLGLPART